MSHSLYHVIIDIAIILSRPVITTSCHLLRRLPGTNFLELLELFPDEEDENNNSSSSSIDGKIDNLRGCSSDDDGGYDEDDDDSDNDSDKDCDNDDSNNESDEDFDDDDNNDSDKYASFYLLTLLFQASQQLQLMKTLDPYSSKLLFA